MPLVSLAVGTGYRLSAVRLPDPPCAPMPFLRGDVLVGGLGAQPRKRDDVAAPVDGESIRRAWPMQCGRPVLPSPNTQIPTVSDKDLHLPRITGQVARSTGSCGTDFAGFGAGGDSSP